MKDIKVNIFVKNLLRFAPFFTLKHLARKMGVAGSKLEQANKLFFNSQRIDIFPSNSRERGFILILDCKLALFFDQDGDHFIYDGFEVGEYEKGDVTVFDRCQSSKEMYPHLSP